jgi:RNA polymerase sigma-54 factor
MSLLSPRLQIKVAQKQILTPGLVQMVTLLQLNRLELKEMIDQELAENPVLEESVEATGEELTAEELLPLLEAERVSDPADQSLLEASFGTADVHSQESMYTAAAESAAEESAAVAAVTGDTAETTETADAERQDATDPFDEIDFGSFFDDYLDPGFKSPDSETVDRPSFETFLSSPVTLADHLGAQLSMLVISEGVRAGADAIVGNLDDDGYLRQPLEELAQDNELTPEDAEEALHIVQGLDPAGIAARDLRECLLLQLESRSWEGCVAWQMVSQHMKLLEQGQTKELAKQMGRPLEHIQAALTVIRSLDPRPGLRFTGRPARPIEPDVYISKEGDDWIIQLNDEDLPQLRLNGQYRHMLDRSNGAEKEVRNYVKERFASAIQLMKNIEQRKQTILKVCQAIVRRQPEFLDRGIDFLKPMMIKDVAEEIGVHPSTVSRAVANKYAHTPQGVYELRYFFSEAVQGPLGGGTPLLLLKRRVKKMIEEEDSARPLTDEHITEKLRAEGIEVTRRTVAKYREDMGIPSTHQRRVRN